VQGPDSTNQLRPPTPFAGQALLSSINEWLRPLISPFIQLEVCNPVYVKITVRCTVRFIQGVDPGKHLEMLNEELLQYLSPWYYDGMKEADAGYYASSPEISAFIQTRPYVAFLDTMELVYDPPPDQLATDWYMLTSADRHVIRLAGETICEP
jgi:hypothetical protein